MTTQMDRAAAAWLAALSAFWTAAAAVEYELDISVLVLLGFRSGDPLDPDIRKEALQRLRTVTTELLEAYRDFQRVNPFALAMAERANCERLATIYAGERFDD